MSNVPLPWEWSENPPGPSPYTYQVPGSLNVMPYTSTATYDGTSAVGSFVPTLSIYSQSGGLLARVFPENATLNPGDVAGVTFIPPFGSAAGKSSGGGGNGIQFTAHGVYGPANSGDALDVTTNVGDITLTSARDIFLGDGAGAFAFTAQNLAFATDATAPQRAEFTLDPGIGNNPSLGIRDSRGNHLVFAIDRNTVPVGGLVLGYPAGQLSFYGGSGITKPTVTGSRGGNAALASLLTQLANLGLITDSTTP